MQPVAENFFAYLKVLLGNEGAFERAVGDRRLPGSGLKGGCPYRKRGRRAGRMGQIRILGEKDTEDGCG